MDPCACPGLGCESDGLRVITAAQLAAMQATVAQTLTETATVKRLTRASDGMGGTTETWATAATVSCSRSRQLNQAEQAVADRLSVVSAWIVRVPAAADVRNADRLVIGTSTLEVVSLSGETITVSRRVLCQEVV